MKHHSHSSAIAKAGSMRGMVLLVAALCVPAAADAQEKLPVLKATRSDVSVQEESQ